MEELIGLLANGAAIVTAVVATYGYCAYRIDRLRRRERLEAYLEREQSEASDQGQRSLTHLTAKLGLTEAEMLQASVQSRHIRRVVVSDKDTGRATEILLTWRN
jgi:hypothetical protein